MKYRDKVGFFDKVILNDSLERAYNELKEFIQAQLKSASEGEKQTTKAKLVDEKSKCDNKL
jgi:guanylate kinase